MDKLTLHDIHTLTVWEAKRAIQTLKSNHVPSPYKVRLGVGVEMGEGTAEYLKQAECVVAK